VNTLGLNTILMPTEVIEVQWCWSCVHVFQFVVFGPMNCRTIEAWE